jgi:DivIVA domain-containing protein
MGDAVTSQGQRFRRRALRRGYKVDEVDSFLDRVEATLAGEQIGAPVGAQEVHDVVFRVRFGGYDEWQVDLHLDRVERQLAELEERGGRPMGADRGGMVDRGMPDRGMPDRGMPDRGMPDRGMPDRGMPDRGMPDRGMPDRGMAQQPSMGRGAPPTERIQLPSREDQYARGDQYARDDQYSREDPYDRPMSPPPPMAPRPVTSMPAPGNPEPYGRYDEPTGYGQQQAPAPSGYDQGERYDAFEPGRHGKTDMTAEIRMPDRDSRGGGFGMGGPAPMSAPPMSQSPMPSSPMSGPPTGGGGDLHRVDQLRRTFQPRRFGSGYDPVQVDRLFESILAAMSGRGPMPVNENELETLQFGLVPGGYFEAEVDAALREVRDILRRG